MDYAPTVSAPHPQHHHMIPIPATTSSNPTDHHDSPPYSLLDPPTPTHLPPLLSLPAELRNKIYHLTLLPSLPYEAGRADLSIYISTWPNPWKNQPALTLVSHSLRSETIGMFYGLNTFTIMVSLSGSHEGSVGMDAARVWLGRIGRVNAGRIRRVRVGFVMLWPDEEIKKRRLVDVREVLRGYGVRVGETGVVIERIN